MSYFSHIQVEYKTECNVGISWRLAYRLYTFSTCKLDVNRILPVGVHRTLTILLECPASDKDVWLTTMLDLWDQSDLVVSLV